MAIALQEKILNPNKLPFLQAQILQKIYVDLFEDKSTTINDLSELTDYSEDSLILNGLEYNPILKTQYHIYDLARNGKIYNLKLVDRKSTTISNLLKAFTHQPVPDIDKFIEVLENKIKLKLGLFIE